MFCVCAIVGNRSVFVYLVLGMDLVRATVLVGLLNSHVFCQREKNVWDNEAPPGRCWLGLHHVTLKKIVIAAQVGGTGQLTESGRSTLSEKALQGIHKDDKREWEREDLHQTPT